MDAAADPLQTPRQAEGPEPAGKPVESQDDGYETSNSGEARRRGATPARSPPPPPPQAFAPYDYTFPYKFPGDGGYPHNREAYVTKRDLDDPYSFVEEEACMLAPPPPAHPQPPPLMPPHHHHHMMMAQPKKRGRKKKIKDENGMEIKCEVGMEGALVARPVKERKKHDRFNGMSEEEVARRTLPDHLAENLDIIIIGINPGLFAAYKGHHYAGPGNHFWKCLYLSGLTREQMSADEDYKLLNFGIGFTNMVARPTKGSADLTRREIKEGSAILLEKLQTFRPKVAVFNGKLIYEVFSGKKDFCFGKQPDTVVGTNTYMWVMPSSSARCAQLPRAADKVPFYAALKKFRDYLNGLVPHVSEDELVFPDTTGRRPQDELEIRRLTMEPEPGDTIILEDGTEVPIKKKRGRPKKVKLENGEVAPPTPRAPRAPRPPPTLDANGEPPKKKRGRPKKIRPDDPMFLQHQANQLLQQQQQQQPPQQPPQQQPPQQLPGMMEYPEQYQQPLMFHQPYHQLMRSNTPCGMEVPQQQQLHSMQDQYVYSPPRRHFSPHQTPTRYSHSPAPMAGRSTPYAASPAAFPAAAASPAAFPAASPAYSRTHTPLAPQGNLEEVYPASSPAYASRTHTPIAPQGGSSCGSAASGGCGLGAASPHAPSPLHAVDFSPPPTVQSSVGVEESGESSVAAMCPLYDNERLYDCHPGGSEVAESPRLDQMHQHPGMYQTNYNRATPDGSSEAFSPNGGFRRSEGGDFLHSEPATPQLHHEHLNSYPTEHADSPVEFNSTVNKPKPQDVASKSLSGLESLVDQIPSIAEAGGAPPPANQSAPPADNAPAIDYPPLYPPYPPYGTPPYANNGSGVTPSNVASYGGWVGYGGGWGVGGVGAVGSLRGAGYLPDWQYPYCPSYYPQPYLQYPQQQTHYLSTPGLLDLHKNGEHSPGVGGVPAVPSVPSVGFGGFC